MITAATSKWKLDREARTASLVLRRIRPECPKDNLRELTGGRTKYKRQKERQKS